MNKKNSLESLKKRIKQFENDFNNHSPLFQFVATHYTNNFSLLCQQNYINAIALFPTAQKDIQRILQEIIQSGGFLSDSNPQQVRNAQMVFERLGAYDLEQLLIDYVNACNIFIALFKAPQIDSFEKRLGIAQPVINAWTRFNDAANLLLNEVEGLQNVLSLD